MKKKIGLLTILFLAAAYFNVAPANAQASLTVNSPGAGQVWAAGNTENITWAPANPPVTKVGQAAPTVFIDLNSVSTCPANSSSCSTQSGVPYIIAESAPDTGSFSWDIPSTISLTYQGPVTVTVGLSDSSAQGSSSQFYLTSPNQYLSQSPLVAPNGGEQWPVGSSQTITWANASSSVPNININLVPISLASCSSGSVCTTQASSSIYTIASGAANNGSYFWYINGSSGGQVFPPGQYIVSLTDPGNGNVLASSAGAFTLTAQSPNTTALASSTPPQITGVNPNSGNVGQLVNVIGSGFTPTGNTLQFGQGTYINNLTSPNGLYVQFTVPRYTQPCPPTPGVACPLAITFINPGAYGISVTNTNGSSNTMPFQVTGTSTSPALPTTATPVGFPDGSLVMASGNPTVYLVSGGQFVPFTSAAVFLARGYQWAQVQTIPPSQLNAQYISIAAVLAPNGSIIKTTNNPMVYLVVDGQKSAIPSLAVFNALGLNFSNLITLTTGELQNYPNAPMQE